MPKIESLYGHVFILPPYIFPRILLFESCFQASWVSARPCGASHLGSPLDGAPRPPEGPPSSLLSIGITSHLSSHPQLSIRPRYRYPSFTLGKWNKRSLTFSMITSLHFMAGTLSKSGEIERIFSRVRLAKLKFRHPVSLTFKFKIQYLGHKFYHKYCLYHSIIE